MANHRRFQVNGRHSFLSAATATLVTPSRYTFRACVVRPGGRVIVLEFGQPKSRMFGAIYDFYRRNVLPRLGGMVTGDKDAYDYLERSAGRFPCGDDFVALMNRSGAFRSVEYVPLTFGIAYLYKGVKA